MQQDYGSSSTTHSYKNRSTPSGMATDKAETNIASARSLTDSSASRGSWYRSAHLEGLNARKPAPSLRSMPTSSSVTATTLAHACTEKVGLVNRNLISVEESRHFWS